MISQMLKHFRGMGVLFVRDRGTRLVVLIYPKQIF